MRGSLPHPIVYTENTFVNVDNSHDLKQCVSVPTITGAWMIPAQTSQHMMYYNEPFL